MKYIQQLFYSALFLVTLFGCSTEVPINAEPKDIWAVFSILDQNKDVQYIRVSRGFLPESNALDYARENDLSAKGLLVTLTSATGKTYQAIEIDSIPKTPADGTFFPFTTLYKIETAGDEALEDEMRYDLSVTMPGDDAFELTAHTTVPRRPRLGDPVTICNLNNSNCCLRKVSIEKTFTVEWPNGGGALGFELRAFLAYTADGVADTAWYGPTQLITTPRGCKGQGLCHRFREDELIEIFGTQMEASMANNYTYIDTPSCGFFVDLPTAMAFEVTAVDTVLSEYIQVNDPKFADFNTVSPEYTNIQTPDGIDMEAFGILGAISKNIGYIRLGECAEYRLRLNNTPQPFPNCIR